MESSFLKLSLSLLLIILLSGCTSPCNRSLYNKKPAFYAYISGDIKTGKIWQEHYSKVYATPASCQKVITALLAYKVLGKDFRYTTNLYTTKKNGKIEDLIISFSGDPTLTTDELLKLLSPLKNTKARKIILDASVFNTPAYSKNIIIDDVGTEYAPPVSAINIDGNLISLTAYATELAYKMDSKIISSSEATDLTINWDNDHVKVRGNLNNEDKAKKFLISPERIDIYIQKKMQHIIKQLNITGKMVILKDTTKLPTKSILINSISSELLSSIIPPALKKSDNLVFDSLYLTIIHMVTPKAIKDWQDGDKIIKNLAQDNFVVNLEGAYFVDGSGLSRYNRIQPRQLFAILRQGYADNDFINALPYPGEINSTLEKRNILKNNIRSKTGNMSGISCLCGYKINGNKSKAFVFMTNSFMPPSREFFPVIDDFVSKCLVK